MNYTKQWGKPQGNELIWGRLILRMVGVHRFKKVAYFDNYVIHEGHKQKKDHPDEWKRENESTTI